MQQKRLIVALLISTAILFLWSYFVPVKPPQPSPSPSPQATQQPTATPTSVSLSTPTPLPAGSPAAPVNAAPHRMLSIRTPLYEAKIDSRGAEPISWIIKKNKKSGNDIYSVAGNKRDRVPLELISPEGLKRQPRQVPLQLLTGDAVLDSALSSGTYKLEGVEAASGDVDVSLAPGERKQLTFVLEDSASRLQVRKTLTFDADRYDTDLTVLLK